MNIENQYEFNNTTICNFWNFASDINTIYIRLDDDIVWLSPSFINDMIKGRLKYRNAFLVSANIINNVRCDFMHQSIGLLSKEYMIEDECMCKVGWSQPKVAEWKHRIFLNTLKNNNLDYYIYPDKNILNYTRFSINSISWFGKDIDKFPLYVDEEQYTTVNIPQSLNKPCILLGNPLASHFAFGPQRDYMDTTDILQQYDKLI